MPSFTFTKEDFERGKLFVPGWYKVKFVKVTEKASKAGDSNNYICEFEILDGPPQEDGNKPVGKLNRLFSEKAPGFAIPFFEALGAKPEPGKSYMFENGLQRELWVYNENRMYEGAKQNDVKDFKSVEAMASLAKA